MNSSPHLEARHDPHDLQRFVTAQEAGGTYAGAIEELRGGHKSSHWMWFVFPQIEGLGGSPMSRRFAIRSLDEARAYLDHPVLGPRLRDSAAAVVGCGAASAQEIFGELDAVKLRSSMTLFQRAAPDEPVFGAVLERYFEGRADPETEGRL